MEIEPTTFLVWYDKDTKELWEPRINRIKKAYLNTELLTVLRGYRDIFIYHVNSSTFDKSYDFLRKNKLKYYPTNKSGVYSGFSHKHRPVEQGKPYMLYGACVRQDDDESGEIFMEANNRPSDHDTIGKLLGYPKCCREFFSEKWSNPSVDPMYEVALNTNNVKEIDNRRLELEVHPYCNNLLRYFGIRITPHIPHSFQCEETIKMGETWIDIMREIDPKASEWALELSSLPLTWNVMKGVAIIETDLFRGITNSDYKELEHEIINKGWSHGNLL